MPAGSPPQSLTYPLPIRTLPTAAGWIYVIWYDDLNVISYQNARASLLITRNQDLMPGKRTNEPFVYRRPPLSFTNLAVPNLVWDQSILFGSGPVAGLPAALSTVFAEVLGTRRRRR